MQSPSDGVCDCIGQDDDDDRDGDDDDDHDHDHDVGDGDDNHGRDPFVRRDHVVAIVNIDGRC